MPDAPEGWMTYAPRDEIRPEFGYDARGGPDGKGAFIIRADRREGLAGAWKKSFPVVGGKSYRFTARYQAEGVAVPRRSVLAELHWRDGKGKKVPLDHPAVGTLAGCLREAGLYPTPQGFGAATDLAWYGGRSLPGIICGPGRLAQCHVADEYIDTEQLLLAANVYALMLVEWCH